MVNVSGELMTKIFYADIDTPVGRIWAAKSKKGLVRLNFPCQEEKFLDEVIKQTKTDPEYRPSKLDDLGIWLDKYFSGQEDAFDNPFDLEGTTFQKQVWREIHKIPYGKLISYGEIAENINRPKASRAVGNAVGANPVAIVIPCHRVVWSNGGIGGFGGGLGCKRILLKVEGILSSSEGTPEKGVDLSKFF